jgi:hypothetical protein
MDLCDYVPGARAIMGQAFPGPGAAFYTNGYANSHDVGELFFAKIAPYSDRRGQTQHCPSNAGISLLSRIPSHFEE